MKMRLLVLIGVYMLFDWVVVKADHYARSCRAAQVQTLVDKKGMRNR
ncbi:hypothetical protein JW872_02840 [Candidatus Babeliales bacterium]|nr:hypothetical protein [Candidatus Babeliales bacterium]